MTATGWLHMSCFRLIVAGALAVALAGASGCSSIATTAKAKTPSGTVASAVAGRGTPTIVLQSGLGDDKDTWAPVFSRLAESGRVFAYDRPGYGDSSSVQTARDPCTIATELRDTLRASGLTPPYLLVGHSLGGLYQYAFAKLYPNEVAGLVLLEPTHPRHWQRMQNDAPAMAAIVKGLRITSFSRTNRAEFDDQARCLERIDMTQPVYVPARLLYRKHFQGIESGAFASMVRSLESDWQRLLGIKNSRHINYAGHYLHRDQPEEVIREIRTLLSELPARP